MDLGLLQQISLGKDTISIIHHVTLKIAASIQDEAERNKLLDMASFLEQKQAVLLDMGKLFQFADKDHDGMVSLSDILSAAAEFITRRGHRADQHHLRDYINDIMQHPSVRTSHLWTLRWSQKMFPITTFRKGETLWIADVTEQSQEKDGHKNHENQNQNQIKTLKDLSSSTLKWTSVSVAKNYVLNSDESDSLSIFVSTASQEMIVPRAGCKWEVFCEKHDRSNSYDDGGDEDGKNNNDDHDDKVVPLLLLPTLSTIESELTSDEFSRLLIDLVREVREGKTQEILDSASKYARADEDWDEVDWEGRNSLMLACQHGQHKTIPALISLSPRSNKAIRCPEDVAVTTAPGTMGGLQRLLSVKACADIADRHGRLPLHYAFMYCTNAQDIQRVANANPLALLERHELSGMDILRFADTVASADPSQLQGKDAEMSAEGFFNFAEIMHDIEGTVSNGKKRGDVRWSYVLAHAIRGIIAVLQKFPTDEQHQFVPERIADLISVAKEILSEHTGIASIQQS
eukprot:g629.t1